jgi:hypothetical protein
MREGEGRGPGKRPLGGGAGETWRCVSCGDEKTGPFPGGPRDAGEAGEALFCASCLERAHEPIPDEEIGTCD